MAVDGIPAAAIQKRNADLVDAGTWSGAPSPRPTPLPGHEHDVDWDDLPLAGFPMPIAPGGDR